jgi:hypothetical protein
MQTPAPEQIRIHRASAMSFVITCTWGLMNTSTYSTTDWKTWLERRGWNQIPRVWS